MKMRLIALCLAAALVVGLLPAMTLLVSANNATAMEAYSTSESITADKQLESCWDKASWENISGDVAGSVAVIMKAGEAYVALKSDTAASATVTLNDTEETVSFTDNVAEVKITSAAITSYNTDHTIAVTLSDGSKNASLEASVTLVLKKITASGVVNVLEREAVLEDNIAYIFYANVGSGSAKATVNGAAVEGNEMSVELAPAQMNDAVTVELTDENGLTYKNDYTLSEYALKLLEDNSYSSVHELVKAMLNYGAAAQTYFNYNAGNTVSGGTLNDSQTVPTAGFASFVKDSAVGINPYGATLLYQNKTGIRYFFDLEEGSDINSYAFNCRSGNSTFAATSGGTGWSMSKGTSLYLHHTMDIELAQTITIHSMPVGDKTGKYDSKSSYYGLTTIIEDTDKGGVSANLYPDAAGNLKIVALKTSNKLSDVIDLGVKIGETFTLSLKWTTDEKLVVTVNGTVAGTIENVTNTDVLNSTSEKMVSMRYNDPAHNANSPVEFSLSNCVLKVGADTTVVDYATLASSGWFRTYGTMATHSYTNTELTAEQHTNGKYYVDVTGILPQDMDKTMTVTVKDSSDKVLTFDYSCLSYITKMYHKSGSSANLKSLLDAMYNYYYAADAYAKA